MTNIHPFVADALKALEDGRARVTALNDDAHRLAALFAAHPDIPAHGYIQESTGCVAYNANPDTMANLAGLLRDLRAAYPDAKYQVTEAPEHGLIHYYLGPLYLRVALSRKCTFKKVGSETVEKPIYELVCE